MNKPLPTEGKDPLFLQSLARALDVLECFSNAPSPKSMGEIAAETGVNKSAVQRIAHTLMRRGYLAPDARGGLTLGATLLDRSFDYLRANPLIERANPVLTDLRRETRERVDLSLFDADPEQPTIVYAVRMRTRREPFYATLPGRRFPATATSGGRACLALLPDPAVDRVLAAARFRRMTPHTLMEAAQVRERIRFAREHGYACSVEEALLGEIVLAAAVRDAAGAPIGAIHVASSLSEWSQPEFCDRFAPLAMAAAQAISG